MIKLRRIYFTIPIILGIEIYFYSRYVALGAEFHFWLHGLFGATLGLMALTIWRLVHRRIAGKVSPFEAGFVGHIYSAVPDIIFLGFGVLHMYWMDVFALHISLHFVPHALLVQLALFILALLAYGLASTGRRKPAFMSIGLIVGLTLVALVLRQPMPQNLNDINQERQFWMCPLVDTDGAVDHDSMSHE